MQFREHITTVKNLMNRERSHLWAQDTKNLSPACNWHGGVAHLAVIAVYWPVTLLAQGGPASPCQRIEETLKSLD